MWNPRADSGGTIDIGKPRSLTELSERLEELSFVTLGSSPTIPPLLPTATSNLAEVVMTSEKTLPLLKFPPEVLDHVLSFCTPAELAQVAQACKTLRTHVNDDLKWQALARDLKLPVDHELPSPFGNWKEFYISHYPYWILPQHKLWVADKGGGGRELLGQIAISRYDYRTGQIDVLRVQAVKNVLNSFRQWSWDQDVIIHDFEPRVSLALYDPIVRLELESYEHGTRLQKEIETTRGLDRYEAGLRSTVFLARAIPETYQDVSMALWPPSIIPNTDRVRCDSSSFFRDPGHKPASRSQMSETTFRTRTWSEMKGNGGRPGPKFGEHVITFSTLPSSCYTPTPDKPYRGIWVGDYAGHGCEFLLIIQKSAEECEGIAPIVTMSPEHRARMNGLPAGLPMPPPPQPVAAPPLPLLNDMEEEPGCSGRLEAIKLTGDVNVPRGLHSFIVEDMSNRGLVRIADEHEFKGARIVKAKGHVASRYFKDDGYIASQLILVSHDCLAQYWEEFGHISFLKRVNIDDFLDVEQQQEDEEEEEEEEEET